MEIPSSTSVLPSRETAATLIENPKSVRFLCSYDGEIQPLSHKNQLSYVGGETTLIVVDRNIDHTLLRSKLSDVWKRGSNRSGAFSVRYQLPGEDLELLISVMDDNDLEQMMEVYEEYSSRASTNFVKMRLFLFPAPTELLRSPLPPPPLLSPSLSELSSLTDQPPMSASSSLQPTMTGNYSFNSVAEETVETDTAGPAPNEPEVMILDCCGSEAAAAASPPQSKMARLLKTLNQLLLMIISAASTTLENKTDDVCIDIWHCLSHREPELCYKLGPKSSKKISMWKFIRSERSALMPGRIEMKVGENLEKSCRSAYFVNNSKLIFKKNENGKLEIQEVSR